MSAFEPFGSCLHFFIIILELLCIETLKTYKYDLVYCIYIIILWYVYKIPNLSQNPLIFSQFYRYRYWYQSQNGGKKPCNMCIVLANFMCIWCDTVVQ